MQGEDLPGPTYLFFTYLKGRMKNRQRERPSVFLVCRSNDHNGRGWARLKARACNSTRVSHVGGKDPRTSLPILSLPSRVFISRELGGGGVEEAGPKQVLHPAWNTGVLSGSSAAMPQHLLAPRGHLLMQWEKISNSDYGCIESSSVTRKEGPFLTQL